MILQQITQVAHAVATEAQTATIQQWSDPFHFIMYLFIGLVLAVIYYEWKWSRDCDKSVSALIIKASGHSYYELVPLEGSSITLVNQKTKKTKVWPINELTTIIVPYPGIAFIPRFLQKEIREVILSEEDWEPITNRSPHRKNVASPDVLDRLVAMAEFIEAEQITDEMTAEQKAAIEKDKSKLTALQELIDDLKDNVSTYPTRELIASPALFGNLLNERISEAITALGAQVMQKLENVTKQLARLGAPINAMLIYILIAMSIIASVAGIWVGLASKSTDKADIEKIKHALGIIEEPPVPQYTITPVTGGQ